MQAEACLSKEREERLKNKSLLSGCPKEFRHCGHTRFSSRPRESYAPKGSKSGSKWHQKGYKMTPGGLKMWLWTELCLNYTNISAISAQICVSFWEPFPRPSATIWQYSSNKNAPSNEDRILTFLDDFPALPGRPDPPFHIMVFTGRNAFPLIHQKHVFLALCCSFLAPFGARPPPKGHHGAAQNAL